ncbi:hypothetical protein ABK040_016405 [Willaertia magna]
MNTNNYRFTLDENLSTEEILQQYEQHIKERTNYHFGYPYNLNYDLSELQTFLNYSINNLGDPYIESNYGVHSRPFEQAVISFFAKLWKIEASHCFGYVTNAGTEGNLYGVLMGREKFENGYLIASAESHYSVFKAAKLYRMDYVRISSLYNGEINYEELEKELIRNKALQKKKNTNNANNNTTDNNTTNYGFNKNEFRPVILNVNIGTTVKGAVDNLDTILEILKRNNYTEDEFYIHCDGALFALILPFVQNELKVDFTKPIGSISVSGHKFIGCPFVSGIVVTRKENVENLKSHIDYLNSVDTTIMGSRNGQSCLYLWLAIRKKGGLEGFAQDAKKCIEGAKYMEDLLLKEGISCLLNKNSNTVVFERPQDEKFIRKWQLACEGNIAHVIIMQNITKEVIEQFVEELKQIRKLNEKEVCVAKHVSEKHCLCTGCGSGNVSLDVVNVKSTISLSPTTTTSTAAVFTELEKDIAVEESTN